MSISMDEMAKALTSVAVKHTVTTGSAVEGFKTAFGIGMAATLLGIVEVPSLGPETELARNEILEIIERMPVESRLQIVQAAISEVCGHQDEKFFRDILGLNPPSPWSVIGSGWEPVGRP